MKHIKLEKGVGKYTDGKEVINICENLEFQVDYNFDKQSEVYFVADNGIIQKKGRIENNKFSLPCSFLNVGDLKLKIIVSSIDKNEEFKIEDLSIVIENGECKTIPEIVIMQDKIDGMKEEINNYSKLVEKLERKNEILTKLVGGLYDTDIKAGE